MLAFRLPPNSRARRTRRDRRSSIPRLALTIPALYFAFLFAMLVQLPDLGRGGKVHLPTESHRAVASVEEATAEKDGLTLGETEPPALTAAVLADAGVRSPSR